MVLGAFQPSAFQPDAFQVAVGDSDVGRTINPRTIPRWLVRLERLGHVSHFSDVGGQVEDAGPLWFPAIASVSLSPLTLDVERFQVGMVTATVTFSPHVTREEFVDKDELGQAYVTVSAWRYDWRRREMRAFPILSANAQDVALGFDGAVTSFRLAEDFDFNPDFPLILVDLSRFTRAQLGIGNQNAGGAMFRPYTFVYGNAQHVPAFELFPAPEDGAPEDARYFIAGHNVKKLPTGAGTPARFRDRKGYTYIGVENLSEAPAKGYTFKRAQQIKTAGDLVRKLAVLADYPEDRVDASFYEACRKLDRFGAAGYVDSDGPLWELFSNRYNQEFLFAAWQEGGTLRGCQIDPFAPPTRVLVIDKDLLELDEGKARELQKYTHFKVRYQWRGVPIAHSPAGSFFGKHIRRPSNTPYLAELAKRWGRKFFGSPVQWARHADSVDLPDVESDTTAATIIDSYVRLMHRGRAVAYLQWSEYAEKVRLGDVVALVDPDRGFDEKPAILIGREWVTPEFVVNRFRTIEEFEQSRGTGTIQAPATPAPSPDGPALPGSCIPTFGEFSGSEDSCFEIFSGSLIYDESQSRWGLSGTNLSFRVRCSCYCSGETEISWGAYVCNRVDTFGHDAGEPDVCVAGRLFAGPDCDHLLGEGQGKGSVGAAKVGKASAFPSGASYGFEMSFTGTGSIWLPFIAAPTTTVLPNLILCGSASSGLDDIA